VTKCRLARGRRRSNTVLGHHPGSAPCRAGFSQALAGFSLRGARAEEPPATKRCGPGRGFWRRRTSRKRPLVYPPGSVLSAPYWAPRPPIQQDSRSAPAGSSFPRTPPPRPGALLLAAAVPATLVPRPYTAGSRLQDKKGPFIVSLIGSVPLCAGYLLASRAGSLGGLYATSTRDANFTTARFSGKRSRRLAAAPATPRCVRHKRLFSNNLQHCQGGREPPCTRPRTTIPASTLVLAVSGLKAYCIRRRQYHLIDGTRRP
jgi:hypothetical protein